MAIDQFIDSRDLNIKDLVVTEPARKPELPFDPRKDISNDKWGKAKKLLQESKIATRVNTPTYGERLSSMYILFPERKDELEVPVFEEMKYGPNFIFAEHIKLFYPNLVTEDVIESNNSGYNFQKMKKIIEDHKDDESYWLSFGGHFIWSSFILYPEKFGEIKAIPGLAETLQKTASTRKNRTDLDGFAEHKLYVKLLDKDPGLSDEEWKAMLGRFHTDPSYRIDLGARMKMLTADKIEMTDKGLKLTMPDSGSQIKEYVKPVPNIRKF
jgi:hypothetical protein